MVHQEGLDSFFKALLSLLGAIFTLRDLFKHDNLDEIVTKVEGLPLEIRQCCLFGYLEVLELVVPLYEDVLEALL